MKARIWKDRESGGWRWLVTCRCLRIPFAGEDPQWDGALADVLAGMRSHQSGISHQAAV